MRENALRKYLSRRDAPSLRSLAVAVGVSHSTLSRYAAGLVIPGLARAYALERVTGGRVPARGWARQRRTVPIRIEVAP
jgi:transcriptional regulator with XRE-family HTH domain